MAKQMYAIEPNGPKRVTVSWKAFWKDFTVAFDGVVVGMLSGQKEVKEGRSFQLPDGSVLDVKLVQNFASAQLEVLRNGKPLPGSGTDPGTRLKQSYGFIYFVGGVNVLLGLIALLVQIELFDELGIGLYSLVVGLIYLMLGYFVQRRSKPALIIALVLYGIETVLGLLGGNVAGVVVRGLLFFYMAQGLKAIKELKAEEAVIVPE